MKILTAQVKLIFFFIFLIYGSSTMAADSTQLVLPATIKPQTAYTQTTSVPPNPGQFVSNTTNMCQNNETRDACFVRYTVSPTSVPGQYNLNNQNLQCPTGYFSVATFDNRAIDLNDPTATIYYFDAQTFYPVTQAQYDVFSQASFTCAIPSNAPVVDSGDHCMEGSCGGPSPVIKNVNGYMTQKTQLSTWTQDTYNGGVKKCEHYSLSGCPSWCSRWQWESYQYQNVQCTRQAGFYKMPPVVSADITNSISPQYTPSVIICSKPNVAWHPQA